MSSFYGAVHHANVRDDATELVEHRIEDKRPERRIHPPCFWRGYPVYYGLKDVGASHTRLCRNKKRFIHWYRKYVLDFARNLRHVSSRQIDLVQHRNNLKLGVLGEVCVGNSLSLHTLRSIHHQESPFACAHRPRDLVCKVDMAGGVQKVEEILAPILCRVLHGYRMALYGYPAFTLKVHGVKGLFLQFPCRHCVRKLKYPVGKGRLTVVDMCDYAEVAYVLKLHSITPYYTSSLTIRARGSSSVSSFRTVSSSRFSTALRASASSSQAFRRAATASGVNAS